MAKQDISYNLTVFRQLERDNPYKRYEFSDGKVWEMENTTLRHNFIVRNIAALLDARYRASGCRAVQENVRLSFEQDNKQFFPDVMVIRNFNMRDASVSDPLVIVEVLSESTASKDLGEKLDAYQRCPSLRAYIIVEQRECWIRVYEKSGDFWMMHPLLNTLHQKIVLESLNLELLLTDVYEGIEFD